MNTARHHLQFRLKPACAAVLFALSIHTAQANPLGPTVVNGQASFATSGNTLTITNTPGAIINWQGFSIGANEITRFAQQSASSAVLNRVISNNPSNILGSLQSNGRVFLVNPNGIVFGQGATINVAGLVATSLNMSNADFIAGRYNFTDVPGAQNISNAGNLTAHGDGLGGGQIYLIAPDVENTGIINAPNGEILLAAGHSVELVDTTNPNLRVNITAPAGDATNVGQLIAESGSLGLFGTIVKNSGTVSADSATMQGGKIVFKASQRVEAGGTISASGTGTPSPQPLSPEARGSGGSVELSGASVAVGGTVSADGTQQGGAITINADGVSLAGRISATGGSGQGGSIAIESQTTNLNNVHATLDASGATGGSIREIAGHQITSSATYLATGTAGNGGHIDISAPATKLLSAQIDASGATGGGQIRVGGEYQGGKSTTLNPFGVSPNSFGVSLSNPPLPNAETLAISAGSTIKADGGIIPPSPLAGEGWGEGVLTGNGGTIILWSDLESALYADVSAQGKNGAGGFIELSSAEKLVWGGTANAGVGGQVLMDPKNIVIQDATAGGVQYNLTLGYNYINLPRMTGNDLGAGDNFGSAVSLFGTQLAVGASGDDGSGNVAAGSGAVYLFNNPYTTPTLSGVIGKGYTGTGNYDLTALEASDLFGSAVSLSGTQLAVGAAHDAGSGNAVTISGAVYLFDNPYTAPTLSGIIGKGYTGAGNYDLTALEMGDYFGFAVSLSGTQLAVGAYGDNGSGNAVTTSGAVYLFDNPYTTPTLTGIIGKGYSGAGNYDLTALGVNDFFGIAVSLSGTQLAVGAQGDDGSGNMALSSGAVYLFDNPYTAPTLTGIIGKGYGNYDLTALGGYDLFGSAVSLSGTQLAVGASGDDGFNDGAPASGAVYLFNNPFGTTTLSGTIGKGYTGTGNYDLTALEVYDHFGSAVSLSGTQLAVGAMYDGGSGNLAWNSGAVYLFDNPYTTPTLSGVIGKGYTGAGSYDPGDALEAYDYFGTAVSLSGTQLAVGAMYDAGSGNAALCGAVYLFNNPYTTPTLSGIIGKGYTGTGNYDLTALEAYDGFGSAVSLSGTQLAAGVMGDDGSGNLALNSGAVYLFNNLDTTPTLSGVIGKGYAGSGNYDLAALEAYDGFGSAVSLSGTQLAAGAYGDDGFGNAATDSGAVYLFDNLDTTPALSGTIGKGYTGAGNYDLTALEAWNNFGVAVSLSGTQLAVGAGSGNLALVSGAVYLFNNPFGATALSGIIGKGYTGAGDYDLTALEAYDGFGYAVSLSGTQLAVGAYGDDGFGNAATDSGAVYLFNDPFTAPTLSGIIGKGYTGAGNYDLTALEADDFFGSAVSLSGTQLAVGAYGDDGFGNAATGSGAVYLFTLGAGGSGDPATGQTFAANSALDSTITPASITAILDTGSALILQANNDITLMNAIIANNLTGNGGDFTLQAGRSILVNADITTDNGNLALTANDTLANGVVTADRDVGAAQIAVASGVTLNAGTGSVTLQVLDGAGRTGAQATAGDITLSNAINAGAINLLSSLNIVLSGIASLTASGGNVLLNSDLDGVSGGAISMASGSSITSNGGNITLGGGVAGDGSGNAIGSNETTYIDGIYLTGATINAGGGNISLRGTGFAVTTSTTDSNGIYITDTSAIQTSGAGTITLNGTGGAGAATGANGNSGVRLGTNAAISSVNGAISLMGQGAGSGADNYGLYIHNGAMVEATGSGTITLNGTGSAIGTTSNAGIRISASGGATKVLSNSGAISITGLGGSGGDGLQIVSGAALQSTSGALTLGGTKGSTANSDLLIDGTAISSGGDILIEANEVVSTATGLLGSQNAIDINAGVDFIFSGSTGIRANSGSISIVANGLVELDNGDVGTIAYQALAGNVTISSINGDVWAMGGANITGQNVSLSAANGVVQLYGYDGGNINATAGNTTITTGGALNLSSTAFGNAIASITASGTAIINAGGAITNSGGNLSLVTANTLDAIAVGGIALTTQVANLTTSNTGAGNTLINNTGALTVDGMTDTLGSITLINAGDVWVGDLSVTGTGLLSTQNAIDIQATGWVKTAAMNAASGSIYIAGDAGVDLDANDWTPTIQAQAGDVNIASASGNVMATYWANVIGQNVTLSAAGSVSDGDASNYGTITANALSVSAGSGIDLHTAVGSITTANSVNGSSDSFTLINNTGALTVNGMTDPWDGIVLNNAGSVSVVGGMSANGIALTASGAASDISITGSGGINSGGGAISLNAGQDIIHSGGAQQINTSSGAINLTAGRDILHTGSTTNQINSFSGAMTLMAGRDIIHTDANQINSFSGAMTLMAGRDIIHTDASQINSSSGAMLLSAGRDIVHSGAANQINNSSGSLTITAGQDFTHSASGQINTNSGALNINVGRDFLHSAGSQINTSSGVMTLGVGGDLVHTGSGLISTYSSAQSITVAGNFTVSGAYSGVSSGGGQTITVGNNLTIENGGSISNYSYSSGVATMLQVGNDLILSDGQIWSSGPLYGSVGHDVSITGAPYTMTGLLGTPDIGSEANPFTVGGVIRLNDGTGPNSGAEIHSGLSESIWIHFPNLASGGYFVNGTEGVVSSGSSGFYADGIPAVLDSNLHITYGLTAAPSNLLSFLPDMVNTMLIPGNGASGSSQSTIGGDEGKKKPPPVVLVDSGIAPEDGSVHNLPVCR